MAVTEPIGQRLAAVREAQDLSVGDVAERMGVTHTRIWHIEHGQNDVNVKTAERYLAACGARLEIVFMA